MNFKLTRLTLSRTVTVISTVIRTIAVCTALYASLTNTAVADIDTSKPVISPDIKRDARIAPRIDTESIEAHLFAGAYKMDGFRAEPVAGVKLAYHFNQLLFVEGSFANAKVKDRTLEKMGRPSVFESDTVDYYNFSLGMNVLRGQIFVGKDRAITSDFYIAVGFGRLIADNDGQSSLHFGGGVRALPTDWLSVHMDVRSYFLNESFLDSDEISHNIEYTFGMGIFF